MYRISGSWEQADPKKLKAKKKHRAGKAKVKIILLPAIKMQMSFFFGLKLL